MAGRSPFTEEFKTAHAALKAGGFADSWSKTVDTLNRLSEDGGPHEAHAAALDEVRTLALKGPSGAVAEKEGLLLAAGGYDSAKPNDGTKLTADSRKRLAALKLMRHMRLIRQSGSQHTWLLGLAKSFTDWPSVAMASADIAKLKTYLTDVAEPFSDTDRTNLSDACLEANKWVQKTLVVLADDGDGGKKAKPAIALVNRWFSDANTKDADVTTAIATLTAGFKKIQAVLGSGRLLLTDHPEVRNATDAENKGFWESEAFVKGAREAMDVVYIESAFFKGGNTLTGLKNWTRILVHELSHREVATKDKFYSWQGMKPAVGTFPMADALINADSWAFFCVDAAGQLTDGERNTALAS